MPAKIARSTPRPSFGLPELPVAIHISRLASKDAAKSLLSTLVSESSGECRLKAAVALWDERDELSDELLRRVLKPKVAFDPKFFTKRELKILERVAEFFKEFKATDMSEFSHVKHLPWAQVYQGGKGTGKTIKPRDSA